MTLPVFRKNRPLSELLHGQGDAQGGSKLAQLRRRQHCDEVGERRLVEREEVVAVDA
jgi:hypothetical protein